MATNPRELILADSQFGGGSHTWAPGTWYLGLSKTTPNDDGTNFTEPVGLGYARVAVVNNATNFPPATTVLNVTTKVNGTAFTFANPTGLWGLLTDLGWFTALTGGVPQYVKELDTAITVQNGNTPVQFAAGQLIMPWD